MEILSCSVWSPLVVDRCPASEMDGHDWTVRFLKLLFSEMWHQTFRSTSTHVQMNVFRIKNANGASHLSNFWNFFGAIQIISCGDWWPWTKPGYITMTRRQSNNHWSGDIAVHPAPKISKCKNPLENFSPRFFGIKTASSSLIIFQRAKLSARSITHPYWCNWRTFWRKNAAGRSPRLSCSCTTMLELTGHFQPRRNWPTWASSVLITHPIFRIWPRRTTTCSLDWKNNWKVAIFGPTRMSLLPRRPGWMDNILNFLLSGLQKLEQRVKVYWALWGLCWINPEFGRCSLFPSWSG